MLKKISVIILIVGLNLMAQTYSPVLSAKFPNKVNQTEADDSVKILAVMVDFQTDDFDLTYGDGKFGSIYSEDYGANILDPLPHDKNYFEDHLSFAKNYFEKVSNGSVGITYNVLPDVYTVSGPMRDYSPLEGESFKVLADFSKEVWEMVSSNNPSFNFSDYNLFVVFHAGVGKDISTNDLFGEARDLPSIYLSPKSLQDIYGESFTGFQMADGTNIKNTIILPETESREETGLGGTTLIELTINGLIVSSIASHLGLPDLFDAETGKSAIGRFGLMDGQSLFAFRGLFPPQPSAWEKIYLGWESAEEINVNTENIVLTASEVAQASDSKIIKIPINSSEYYLIENRSRDAYNNGATITYKIAGQVRTKTFSEDIDNFNNAIVDTINGVVLDVDEYDWALPGSGILIWHIDENIIDQGINSNSVNIGQNRGVDLEEADGIQDIGEEFQTIFGDIVIAEGEEFDFWFSSNTSELYDNDFGSSTKPNTKTNSGANSLITINNFSDIGNQMSFNVKFGSDNVGVNETYSGAIDIRDLKITPNNDSYIINLLSETNLTEAFSSLLLNNFSESSIASINHNGNVLLAGAIGKQLNLRYFESQSITKSIETSTDITSPIVLENNSTNVVNIFIGHANGEISKYTFNLDSQDDPSLVETYSFSSSSVDQVLMLDDELFAISGSIYGYLDESTKSVSENINSAALTKNNEGTILALFLTDNNSIYTYSKGDTDAKRIYSSNQKIEGLSLGDLKKDGENYIIINSGNQIVALNLNGNISDSFPYKNDKVENFTATPLIADVNDDNNLDIISLTDNGDIYAVSGSDGKLIDEFPLSIGGHSPKLSNISKINNELVLAVVSSENDVFSWRIKSGGTVAWGNKYGNNGNSSSINSASDENYISTFFPLNRTYNWPNPVYGEETNIRTYVSEDSDVKVKIFDLAGDLVDEFVFFAAGGLDSEYSWSVNDIQSGAYFAHVEVKSRNGKTESKIIKIAVVK